MRRERKREKENRREEEVEAENIPLLKYTNLPMENMLCVRRAPTQKVELATWQKASLS